MLGLWPWKAGQPNSYLSSHVIWVFLFSSLFSFSRSLAVSALAGTAGTAGRARAWSVSFVHTTVIILVVVVFVAACRRLSELNTAVFYLFGEIRFIVLGHI